jgi:hypothetical protein
MLALCRALESRDLPRVYATMTSAYEHAMAKAGLAARLLPADKTAPIQCTFLTQAKPGLVSVGATMTITAEQHPRFWRVTLIKASGGTWQVSNIG